MRMNFDAYFDSALARLHLDSSYRDFANLERLVGQFPRALLRRGDEQKTVTIWCSNDYLGMGQHPEVLAAMKQAIDMSGAGAGGTRNISGTTVYHVRLEQELAALHGKEAALVFTSGFNANETALSTLQKLLPGCVTFSDELNHASMIDGIRHGGGPKRIFRHNDLDHLAELLAAESPEAPKIIAFESVHSMDADRSPIQKIVQLGRRYGALFHLDEVHAVGLYGRHGGGLSEELGLSDQIHVIQGTLGKAFGVQGGYIAGGRSLIDAVRSFGRGLIYTTAMAPAVAAGALRSVQILRERHDLREAHQARVRQLKNELADAGLPCMPSTTHIVPLMVGDARMCKQASQHLLDAHDIYVQAINQPTVRVGTERLRLTPTPLHSDSDIRELTSALTETWAILNIAAGRR